jgi:hypothetical protein
LVNLTEAQVLSPATEDEFIWNLSSSGLYSSKSAYNALFAGRILSPHHLGIWDCWAPLKCKVFAWLAVADRHWTGERKLRHGQSTSDTCAVCDQESESISHLLLQCPFAKQVWFHTLYRLGLQACLPGPDETFSSWFETAATRVAPSLLKAARSIIILTPWIIWKSRNDVVFNSLSPYHMDLSLYILEEARLWILAGAKELRRLPLHARPPDSP